MRVRRGTVRDGMTGEELPLARGIERAAAHLRDNPGLDIIVDGNHRGEVLAMVAALAARNPERIRGFVALPGEDLLMLEHAWSSGVRSGGLETVEHADGLLVIGDPFSSHPRSAKPILDFKRRNRRSPVVVIDSSPRRTALFSTHPVIIDPALVPAAVASVIPKDAAAFPRQSPGEIDPTGGLDRALSALGKCARLGIIIASAPGRGCHWSAAAYYAGLLTRVQGSVLGVLTQYGNARSASRFVASGALLPVGLMTEMAPEDRSVAVVGEQDCLLSATVCNHVARAPHVVHIGLGPMNLTPALDFPGVGFFEDAGSVLSSDADWEFVPPALAPPDGVPSAAGMLKSIMEVAGFNVDEGPSALPKHPEFVAPQAMPPPAPIKGAGPLRGLLSADPEQFVDGQLTGLTSLLGSRTPTVIVATADCTRYGIEADTPVTVSSENGQCAAVAKSCMHQPSGIAVISCTNSDAKGLFQWELCGGIPVAKPSRVFIESSRSAL